MRSLSRTMQYYRGRFCELRETLAIAFAIHGWFIVFALLSTRHHHGRDCESVEGIAIAQAIRGREKTSLLLFANFAVTLRSPLRFATLSSWPRSRAHGIVAITSAICGITCGRFLQLAGFIAIASLRGHGHIAITLARSREKGEHGSQASWWQRRMAPSLEGLLEGRLEGHLGTEDGD